MLPIGNERVMTFPGDLEGNCNGTLQLLQQR
jgi:hypothetical protein